MCPLLTVVRSLISIEGADMTLLIDNDFSELESLELHGFISVSFSGEPCFSRHEQQHPIALCMLLFRKVKRDGTFCLHSQKVYTCTCKEVWRFIRCAWPYSKNRRGPHRTTPVIHISSPPLLLSPVTIGIRQSRFDPHS